MYSHISFFSSIILSIFLLSACQDDEAVQPAATTPAAETVPAAPSGLQVISLTGSEVKLQWKDNSTNETSFIIEVGTDSLSFAEWKLVAANSDTTSISGTFLTTKTYFFRVKALNTTRTSPYSNITFRTLFPTPSDLTIVTFSPSSVTLKWNDNSTFETGFIVEQSIDAAPFTAIDSTGPNVTGRTIPSAFDSSKTYSFRVLARSADSRSGPSNAEGRTLGRWVFVAGGTFLMGRNGPFRDERPIHSVTVSGYYISKYEVTVKEYRLFTDATKRTFPNAPSWGWSDNEPIVNVSWNDAAAYCAWLDSTTVKGCRIPYEAEWEFAARGGRNSRLYIYSGGNTVDSVGWYYLNAAGRTHPIGQKRPNELGIYDMSGNAWEWCADWQGSYSSFPQTNPTGPSGGANKVFRGGSWFDYGISDSECRVETRYAYTINGKVEDGGFRIVKGL
jgi:formylglycine-generating enzyme required for sulfatase activity